MLCHKNLNKGSWSITVGGKVIAHVPEVVRARRDLSSARACPAEGDQAQVPASPLRAVGTLASAALECARTPITYNPYRAGTFTRRHDGGPVNACEFVHFTNDEGAVAVGRVA